MEIPPPEPPDRPKVPPPPPWFPIIGPFCFNPEGPIPEIHHSFVRRLLHHRRSLKPPSPMVISSSQYISTLVLSSLWPSRASPRGPSSSVCFAWLQRRFLFRRWCRHLDQHPAGHGSLGVGEHNIYKVLFRSRGGHGRLGAAATTLNIGFRWESGTCWRAPQQRASLPIWAKLPIGPPYKRESGLLGSTCRTITCFALTPAWALS